MFCSKDAVNPDTGIRTAIHTARLPGGLTAFNLSSNRGLLVSEEDGKVSSGDRVGSQT